MPPLPPDTNCWSGGTARAQPPRSRSRSARSRGRLALLAAVLVLALPAAGHAEVVFGNCQPTADGGVSCDTRPTGRTLVEEETARLGGFNAASPGWDELDPYEGYDDLFSDNWP